MSTTDELARRQTVFREVNETIASLTSLLPETGYQRFVCECSNSGCAESLQLTVEESPKPTIPATSERHP